MLAYVNVTCLLGLSLLMNFTRNDKVYTLTSLVEYLKCDEFDRNYCCLNNNVT